MGDWKEERKKRPMNIYEMAHWIGSMLDEDVDAWEQIEDAYNCLRMSKNGVDYFVSVRKKFRS